MSLTSAIYLNSIEAEIGVDAHAVHGQFTNPEEAI
jgi:hypothetical protein